MISAQALEPVCRRKMKTYAVAWVHSERKLSTRIDNQGHTNPTWNYKFVFRVDEEFLHRDTSAVTIEIYAVHWFRNIHVGSVRAIVGNLIPPISQRPNRQEVQLGMRFVALQVWRPSGRPQGILNIGVALLDSSMRSMPFKKGKPNSAAPPGKSPTGMRFTGLGCRAPRKLGGSTIWTDSELGPSPSEVAAAVAKNLQHNRMEEAESSLAVGWSLDESIEGLRSKLERWRTALPPLYDRGDFPGYLSSEIPTTSTTKHTRNGGRYPRDDGGSFSCFGNICGCAISITCGSGLSGSRKKRL
ncbi:hypothetical protein Gotur_033888 [Gossypium turneri]